MIKILNIDPKNAHIFDTEISKQPSFVKIHHPSCSHCTEMKPAWNKLVKTIKNNYNGNMGLFNIHADALANIKTQPIKLVKGFPTLKIIKNGRSSINYNGDRSYQDMLNFCLKNINLTKILETYKGDEYTKKISQKTRKTKSHKKLKTKKVKNFYTKKQKQKQTQKQKQKQTQKQKQK